MPTWPEATPRTDRHASQVPPSRPGPGSSADHLHVVQYSGGINPHGAQIIFTTHDIGLLGRHQNIRLARDQVWLTEKDQAGATRLYPLTEFRVRNALDDVAGRYLKGRYGAVPFFDKERLLGPSPTEQSD